MFRSLLLVSVVLFSVPARGEGVFPTSLIAYQEPPAGPTPTLARPMTFEEKVQKWLLQLEADVEKVKLSQQRNEDKTHEIMDGSLEMAHKIEALIKRGFPEGQKQQLSQISDELRDSQINAQSVLLLALSTKLNAAEAELAALETPEFFGNKTLDKLVFGSIETPFASVLGIINFLMMLFVLLKRPTHIHPMRSTEMPPSE